MSHRSLPRCLGRNASDANDALVLAMAIFAARVLTAALFEDNHLLITHLLDYFGLHGGAFYQRRADLA